jgi:uncharacterized membrane protein
MFIRGISRVIAFLLLAESLVGALNFTQLLSQIGIYTPLTIALILLRAVVNAFLFVGGWTLANHRPQGPALARYALIASAVLTVFDVGLNLAPTMVYPWWRWEITGAYSIYAATCTWALKGTTYRSMNK